MPIEVRISESQRVSLAVVKRRADPAALATVVPADCGVVWTFVRAHGLPAGRNVAVYWDASIRLEVGVELESPFVSDGVVVPSSTPAGLTASATHRGPYDQLGRTHEAVHAWCASHGYRLRGPRWEVYGHWQEAWHADPSQIRTDVHYLVAEDGRRAG